MVNPLMPFVPRALPANIITIISSSLLYLGLSLSYYSNPPGWLLAVLLILFLVGDHLDGLQARKTNTSSALGEFVDHFLDAINNGVVFMILCLHLSSAHQVIFFGALFSSYLAHSITFLDQYKSGILKFDKISSFEGVLFVAFLLASAEIYSIREFMLSSVEGLKLVEWLILIFSVLSLLLVVVKYARMKFKPSSGWLILSSIGLMAFLMMYVGGFIAMLCLTLFCSQSIARIIRAHLFSRYAPFTPFMLSIAIALLSAFTNLSLIPLLYYLLLLNILHFNGVLRALQNYWHWKNPRVENS